jgi:hypothetical protein
MELAGSGGAKTSGGSGLGPIGSSGLHMRAEQKPTSNTWFQSGGAYVGGSASMDDGEEDLATEDHMGAPPQADESSKAVELQHRYRECLEVKRTLKRNLKKFDDDFVARKGRNPRKADKEVRAPVPAG